MVRPATYGFPELAPLKIRSLSLEELAPFPQLDALWHYECVVSPRSPAAKLQSNHVSPRSPAASNHWQSADIATSPRSPASKILLGSVIPTPHPVAASRASVISPLSPCSHINASSAAPPPLSRFAPAHQSLQRVFSTFDENGDGSVSTQEISRILEKLGISRSEDSLLADIPSLVSKAPGHVDEEEFLLLYESACQLDASSSSSNVNADLDQDLLAAFHVFDKDGNGFISPAELQSVMCSLGFPQGGQLEACADMIARVDENGDGQVDFFEFKKMFHMDNPLISTIQSF